MKHLLIHIFCLNLVLLLGFLGVQAQCIPVDSGEDITLLTQEEVDNFAQNYDVDNVRNLTIQGDMVDLSGLSSLTQVGGDLYIEVLSSDFLSFTGLDNLSEVGGQVRIRAERVTNFVGLGSLTCIGQNLELFECGKLVNFEGLNNLAIIGEDFRLEEDISDLVNFEGLENLEVIGDDFVIGADVGLQNFVGLESLEEIVGSFYLEDLSVPSLAGLESLQSIGEHFILEENHDILSIDGFTNLQYIGGNFDIEAATVLTSITGFNSLTEVGGFFSMKENYSIESINGFEALKKVGSTLVIEDNEVLLSLDGLANLDTIGGSFRIQNNDLLTSIEVFQNLEFIGSYVDITDNAVLSACCACWADKVVGLIDIDNNAAGCNGLGEIYDNCGLSCEIEVDTDCLVNATFETQADVEEFAQSNDCEILLGNITLPSNNSVTDLSPLLGIKEVHGNISIYSNDLDNLHGLDSLTKVVGSIVLEEDLISLEGLEKLTEVQGGMDLIELSITSLAPLSNLETIGGKLEMEWLVDLEEGEEGFQSLTSVGSLYLSYLDASLPGFDNLIVIGGRLYMYGAAIGNFNAFPSLQSIEGKLELEDNDELGALIFPSLIALGSFEIFNGPYRIDSYSFPLLESVGSVYLEDGADVFSFPNLESMGNLFLDTGGDDLVNFNVPNLQTISSIYVWTGIDFNDFNSVVSIDGRCELISIEITSAEGFENLEYIGGNFELQDAENLTDCCNLLCIAEVVQGDFILDDDIPVECNSLDAIAANCPDFVCGESSVSSGISGFVWDATNDDGVYDGTEEGVDGVLIDLMDGDNTIFAQVFTSGGSYVFENIPDIAGDLFVRVNLPDGMYPVTDEIVLVEYVDGTPIDINFGLAYLDVGLLLGEITGLVWEDADIDGVFDDDESVLAGIVVLLYDEDGNYVTSTFSDENGVYGFYDLPAWTYTVVIEPTADASYTTNGGVGVVTIHLEAGETEVIDFGIATEPYPPIDIWMSSDGPLQAPVDSIFDYGIWITNEGEILATGVEVEILMPEGLEFIEFINIDGSYDWNTQIWTVGELEAGLPPESAYKHISFRVRATQTGVQEWRSQVVYVNQFDIDSTPNNGADAEEDDDTVFPIEVIGDDFVDLRLAFQATPLDTVEVGDIFTYEISVDFSIMVQEVADMATGVVIQCVWDENLEVISGESLFWGTYDTETDLWTPGNIESGEHRFLEVEVRALSVGTLTNRIQIIAADQFDIDSTPNNMGAEAVEDDEMVFTLEATSGDLVWPGDANNDGVANTEDILNIGWAFEETGPARAEISMEWSGQVAPNWIPVFDDNVNFKHADCNGDGIVSWEDADAISLNYGLEHAKTETENDATIEDPILWLDMPDEPLVSGQEVVIPIMLGKMDNPLDNIYGVVFNIEFDEGLFIEESINIDFSQSWLGMENSTLLTVAQLIDGHILDIGLCRNTHTNASGQGVVAVVRGIIDDIAGKDESIDFDFVIGGVKAVLADENTIPLFYGEEHSISVINTSLAHLETTQIEVYPNPVRDILTLDCEKENEVKQLFIYSLEGRKMYEATNLSKRHLINVNGWKQGVYVLEIVSESGSVWEKIVVE